MTLFIACMLIYLIDFEYFQYAMYTIAVSLWSVSKVAKIFE